MADTVVFASTELVVTLATTSNTATVAATTTTLTLAAAPTNLTVAATTNNINLAATTQLVTVAAVGDQGPPGPQGPAGAAGTVTPAFYGAFSDYTSQTALANTATVMTFDTVDAANGFSVVSSSRFTPANTGIYNFQWSGQFVNSGVSDDDVDIWIRLNGADVTGSTGRVSIPGKHGSISGHALVGWNFILNLTAGDYIQLVWATSAATTSIVTYTSGVSPTHPSTASLIATFQQVVAVTTSAGDITATAAQALGGQRVCIINTLGQADYATNTTASHKWLSVAISVGAASSGATVTLRTTGLLTEPSWAWTAGLPVYLSTTGLLSQTAPVSPAFLRVVGVATSATTIFIQPQPAIALIA